MRTVTFAIICSLTLASTALAAPDAPAAAPTLAVTPPPGSAAASAQHSSAAPAPLWASKPDIKGFDAIEDDRLAAAQKSIDAIGAARGARTIENTLAPYDEATRNLDSAAYFSYLMEEVAADAPYRDAASA